MLNRSWILFALATVACGCSAVTRGPERVRLLMPDFDATRTSRLTDIEGRFATPAGFVVEEVASNDLVGSVVNMSFDYKGRLAVAPEHGGIRLLEDRDGDGVYDYQIEFCETIKTAHGIHYLGPGDMLVNANGPEGTGLYRLTDTDLDDRADEVTLIIKSRGGIGEHGPHAILTGPDASLYVMYGNHSFPDVVPQGSSPSRDLREDYLLPRYLDPRGHANRIRAPGGTIHRVDLATNEWSQVVGGFRNSFDFAMDMAGEMFTFESDMEWDVGLPWFRPVRAIHAIPGGDYGWRTGSSKIPFYAIDTLPGVDSVGRGSPVGVCFYYHDTYPKRYQGAFFMGDWSRGRIRVLFPKKAGGSYAGRVVDFVLGEPLNVTDLDVGPDGNLYFSMGGRSTHGGIYRVRYVDARSGGHDQGVDGVVRQPMPRSAWGKHAIETIKETMGGSWKTELLAVVMDGGRDTADRLRALEALKVYGPEPDLDVLSALLHDENAAVRAQAVLLMGSYRVQDVEQYLMEALRDEDGFVVRRACEALVRGGLEEWTELARPDALARQLSRVLLETNDRFVRYAARLALMRVDRTEWIQWIEQRGVPQNPRWMLDIVLSLIYLQDSWAESDLVFAKLDDISQGDMDDETRLDFLRVLQLAFIRDKGEDRSAFNAVMGPRLLSLLPSKDWRVNRELQVTLAHMETPGVVEALLAQLTAHRSREEQIHTAYALRTVESGWTHVQRSSFIEWFDRAWSFRGAASMEGFMRNLWDSTLALLPEDERVVAQARKKNLYDKRVARALALMDESERTDSGRSELAQMSFQELSEYLEYDPMTYRKPNLPLGERAFVRAKCASCHVFGSIGKGGGPDLSTVVKRFRRRDILESIMFPSKVISDQYTGVEVELGEWETVSGMVVSENEESLTLITVTGERIDIAQEDITLRRESELSIMPEGLLDTMNLGELVALIQFLEHGSDV